VSDFKLPTPLARVRLTDGRVLEARVTNPDYISWDRVATRKGWPKLADAPFLWQTYLAWSALRREGQLEASWEDFSERLAEQVEMAGLPDAGGELNGHAAVDPTTVPVGPG